MKKTSDSFGYESEVVPDCPQRVVKQPQEPSKRQEKRLKWLAGIPGLFLGSNPQHCSPLYDDTVDASRRVNCRRYENCLMYAAGQDWSSFDCSGCDVRENISLDEWKGDLEGLANVLRAIFG